MRMRAQHVWLEQRGIDRTCFLDIRGCCMVLLLIINGTFLCARPLFLACAVALPAR